MKAQELTHNIKPPDTKSFLQWLKANLFNTWFSTVLTCLALIFLYFVFKGILTWAFTQANWRVIPANLQLFAIGSYPRNQIWQIWVVLYTLSALTGLSAGIWGGLTFRFALVVAGIWAFLAVLPFEPSTRFLFLGEVLVIGGTLFIGRKGKKVRLWVIAGWLLSFPWTMLMLRGFGPNTVLTTNWGGLLLTLVLATIGIVVSFPMGVLLALGRQSTLPAIKWVSIAYIELVRGIPLVTILFMAQIMIPIFMPDVRFDKILRAMFALTFFAAAYMAENVRGGLQAIPKGQHEAAQAIGLNYPQSMLFIVLPQALRSVIPAIVGQFIGLFKDTSLVVIIGLLDLLGIAKTVLANPDWQGLPTEVYLFVAGIYFIFSYSMSYASQKLETALGAGKF